MVCLASFMSRSRWMPVAFSEVRETLGESARRVGLTEMPFGFRNHRLALSRFWCHCRLLSANLQAGSDQGTAMEMHQVRYFLAVARVFNFTRAADECNVTQPSLTRAIKQLE